MCAYVIQKVPSLNIKLQGKDTPFSSLNNGLLATDARLTPSWVYYRHNNFFVIGQVKDSRKYVRYRISTVQEQDFRTCVNHRIFTMPYPHGTVFLHTTKQN